MTAYPMLSDKVLAVKPVTCVPKGKDLAAAK